MVKKLTMKVKTKMKLCEGVEEFILNCEARNLRPGTIKLTNPKAKEDKMMSKNRNESTPINNNLKLFRVLFVVSICIVTILIIYLMIDAFISDNFLQVVICAVGEVIFIIIIIAKVADILAKIGNASKNEIHNVEKELKGMFGEIWHSIDDVSKIKDIKVEHLDKMNNIIDLVLLRNKHEFGIVIDDEAIGIIVDEEESDNPLEVELPISGIKDIEHFWKWLIEFVESNS